VLVLIQWASLHLEKNRFSRNYLVPLVSWRDIRNLEDEDDDEYRGKARLFWVQHEHSFQLNTD
jgi:hypothetical protein